MAVCSGGGHWIEMQRLLPAFEGSAVDLVFVSTHDAADAGQTDGPYYRIRNATRRDRLAFPVRDGIPVMLESEARAVPGQDG